MILKLKSHLGPIAAFVSLSVIAGCAVGPDFKKPAAPNVSGYTTNVVEPIAGVTNVLGGAPQHFVEGLDISGEWWALFHSKPLNDLIERSLTNNPNIKSAQAAVVVAVENLKAQYGFYYPSADASFSWNRARTSEAVSPNTASGALTYTFWTPQVSVSYSPDVFGLNRRTAESLRAQEEQQRFQLAATYITLSANVVSTAIQEASLRAQIAATRKLVDENKRMLEIFRNQSSNGYVGSLQVAAQESQLAQIAATLPPLVKQLAQQRDMLAVLAGVLPSQQPGETFELSSLELPEELPLSLPSKLVEQRPDVRQAEENMHSASALIGVAVANRIPNIALTANVGSTALSFDKIFTSGTGFWGLGATATQPLFEGGTLLHKDHAARAAYVQAAEQYRATVLGAFQNVADTLTALEQDAEALRAAAQAEHAAKVSYDMTQNQLKAGYANYLALLTAEQAYQQAEITLVQAQANRYSDTAALFLALGGGWWHREELTRN